jgi:prophage tail gpP-like protein
LIARHFRHEPIELAATLLRGTAGPQAADQVEDGVGVLRQEIRIDRRERHPGVRSRGQIEVARGDTDDRESTVGRLERLAEHRRVAVVAPLPEALTDDRHRRGADPVVVRRALTGLIPATTTVLSQVFSIEERGRDLFDAAERLDLEGIVAKRKADSYRPETAWYKIKSQTYTQGEGRWELFQKR